MAERDIIPYSNEDSDLGMDGCRFKAIHAKTIKADKAEGGLKAYIDTKATKEELARVEAVASAPNYFARNTPFAAGTHLSIRTPDVLCLNINGKGHKAETATNLSVTAPLDWDTKATSWRPSTKYKVGDYVYHEVTRAYIYKCITAGVSSTSTPVFPTKVGSTVIDGNAKWECCLNYCNADNRAGKDFYIYAIYSRDTVVPSFILSVNSTVPHGYNANNTRKVGGFHCLCADVGTIEGHMLSGYAKGDVLPASVWDLKHRPKTDIGGMVYDEGTGIWTSIYLMTWTGTASAGDLKLYSKFGAAAGYGTSVEKFHCLKWEQWLANQHMRLPKWQEFVHLSLGSNQGTNVAGSATVITTGGSKDTAGRRMISHIGAEDCCGKLYQWGAEIGSAVTGSSSWDDGTTADDAQVGGQIYGVVYRPLFGGAAGQGVVCGSRCCRVSYSGLALIWPCGCRAVSEPAYPSKGITN